MLQGVKPPTLRVSKSSKRRWLAQQQSSAEHSQGSLLGHGSGRLSGGATSWWRRPRVRTDSTICAHIRSTNRVPERAPSVATWSATKRGSRHTHFNRSAGRRCPHTFRSARVRENWSRRRWGRRLPCAVDGRWCQLARWSQTSRCERTRSCCRSLENDRRWPCQWPRQSPS